MINIRSQRMVRPAIVFGLATFLMAPMVTYGQIGPFINHQSFSISASVNNGNLGVNTDGDAALETYPITNIAWLNNISNVQFFVSPSTEILYVRAFGSALVGSCNSQLSENQVYFYRLVQDNDAGGHLEEIFNQDLCINGVPDHVGLYEVFGQNQHVAFVVEPTSPQSPTTQRLHLFDLNALDARQVLILGDDIDIPFLFSPDGSLALFKHGVGTQPSNADYTLVDLCDGSRFGTELQDFNNLSPSPNVISEIIENPPGTGQLQVRITHPGIGAGGVYADDVIPCAAVSGACCNGSTCTETFNTNCGGTFFAGQTCSSNPCTPNIGACCLGMTCLQTTSAACQGTFFPGQPCSPNPCLPPEHTLTINKIGVGTGLVRSTSHAGIFCGNTCQFDYFEGTTVSLVATPDPNAVFVSWGGDCSGTMQTTQVTIGGDRNCSAEFALRQADLSISISDSADPVIAGTALNYTVTVTNNGPDATSGVMVTVTLPVDYQHLSCFPTNGSCSQSAGVVSWNIGSLAIGASSTLTINGNVSGASRNQVSATADVVGGDIDPNMSNNSATETTQIDVVFDLTATKVAAFSEVPQGGNILYTVYISNSGPSAATGVVVDDTLPPGVTTLDGRGDLIMPTPVTCNVGTVKAGRTVPAAIYVFVDPSVAVDTVLTNTATVSADDPDMNPADNTASVDVTVVEPLGTMGVSAFTQLVDTTTPIPQDGQNFGFMGNPSIGRNGEIAFIGGRTGLQGTYRYDNGVVSRVMDTTQGVPGSPGVRFQTFNGQPSIDGNDVAYIGFVPVYAGIYASLNSVIQVIGRIAFTPLPGSPGVFGNWSSPELDNDEIVFYATQVCGFEGVYRWRNGQLEMIADSNTPIPGGTGNFNLFNRCVGYGIAPSFRDGMIVFQADGANNQFGTYVDTGELDVVAAVGGFDPDGAVYESVGRPVTDRGLIAYAARADGVGNLYVRDSLATRVLVDTNTQMPGRAENFTFVGGFFGPNIVQNDSSFIVFQAGNVDINVTGWYCYYHGQVFKIFETGDTLNGGQLFALFSTRSLSGDRLVFGNLGAGNLRSIWAADFGEIVITLGDMNCDGLVDLMDLPLFTLALADESLYLTAQPTCQILNADMNQDNLIDGNDIAMFTDAMLSP